MKTATTRFGLLAVGLTLGIGAAACAEPSQDDCITGDLGCACFSGNLCLQGLSCFSGNCVDLGSLETSGPGDGDNEPGDGDGEPATTGDGDGDPAMTGDGDPDDGDGDGDPGMSDPCAAGPVTLLYKQGTTAPDDFGIASGIFPDNMNANLEIADEFEIPEADQCWCVTSVVAQGFFNNGVAAMSPPDVTVRFYESDAGGMVPLPQPITSLMTVASPGSEQGILDIEFDDGIVLDHGTRWLSVNPHVDYFGDFWRWRMYDELYGTMAATRDPQQVGFGGACTVWTPAVACYMLEPDLADVTMQFEVYGVIGGQQCN